jgi:membrane-bound serine protease (ClpP class)
MTFLGSPLFANLLYLLLVFGVWLAALALVTPGTGVFEVLAFFALVGAGLGTAFVSLNSWALIFLVVGAVLFILAFRLPREGLWVVLSATAFSLGSVFLFRLEDGGLAVHPLLAAVVSVMTLGYFWLAIRNAIAAHRAGPTLDPSLVMGQIGEVRTELNPIGSVYVAGELWTARSEVPVVVGDQVRVQDRDGLMLVVEPIE